MDNDTGSTNPFLNSWLQLQNEFLKSQEPFWRQMGEALQRPSEETAGVAEKFWDDARAQSQEWLGKMHGQLGLDASPEGAITHETLRRMLDPWQFLYAGSDEVNQTIQKLVEGPEFFDFATLEQKGLRATQEWIGLRKASSEYRMVTAKAWTRAFKTFSQDTVGNSALWRQGPKAVLNRWLTIANEELIKTQRTQEFLTAQRNLLRAGVDYRLREREIVETWCEAHSMPTRSEVDEIHETLYRLRHEVRALKQELAAVKSAKGRTATRKARVATKKSARVEGENG